MKKIFTLLVLLVLQSLYILPQVYAATITPSTFSIGDIITVEDSNLGNVIPEDLTICFTLSACLTPNTTANIITSWTNSSILLQPPLGIPAKGDLILSFGQRKIQLPYVYNERLPSITSASPRTIVPNSTTLSITGSQFGNFSSKHRICIQDQCILDAYSGDYFSAWSDSLIELQLPNVPGVTNFDLRIEQYLYTQLATSKDIYRTIEVKGLSFEKSPDPKILSLSPTQVTLDSTIVRVTGEHLGNGYDPNYQSICFDTLCYTKDILSSRVITWNDREIAFTVPRELGMYRTLNLSIYLYYPSTGTYKKVGIGPALSIVPTPIISQYTPSVSTGDRIILKGDQFGSTKGSVSIGNSPMEIISWSNTNIEIYVDKATTSGLLEVKNSQGATSLPVYITVDVKRVFSEDTFSGEQWYIPYLGLENYLNTGGAPITVAVIDSGVDFTNPELLDSSWINVDDIPNNGIDDDSNGYIDDTFGWDFITNTPIKKEAIKHNHGTQIAGIIGAMSNNRIGFAGIHDTARIMSLKVAEDSVDGKDPLISFSAAQKAIKYAVDNGAQIINLSFSGATNTAMYQDSLSYAYNNNVLVLAAAGNTSTDLDATPHSPICDDNTENLVLGIGSLSSQGTQSTFTNYGSCIDLYAPGEDILATNSYLDAHQYMYVSGTSFATPIVAAVAAKLWSIHPDWNVAEIQHALISNSTEQDKIKILNGAKTLNATKPNISVNVSTGDAVNFVPEESDILIPIDNPKSKEVEDNPEAHSSESIFNDVSLDTPSYTAITYLYQRGVIEGYSDGTFRPANEINRAEFLKIILEAKGVEINQSTFQSCFDDVRREWFAKYICYAKELGYVQGYTDNVFRPEQTINKVEALKILLEVFGESTDAPDTTEYYDVDPYEWYTPYVRKARSLGITDSGNFLFPSSAVTRGTMAEFTFRMMYIKELGVASF